MAPVYKPTRGLVQTNYSDISATFDPLTTDVTTLSVALRRLGSESGRSMGQGSGVLFRCKLGPGVLPPKNCFKTCKCLHFEAFSYLKEYLSLREKEYIGKDQSAHIHSAIIVMNEECMLSISVKRNHQFHFKASVQNQRYDCLQ